jgi:glycosyl transferase family 25
VVTILVINLERDVERLAHMRTQLDAAKLPFDRFPALRGDELPESLQRFFAEDADLSVGEVGCYASHLAILEKMASGEITSPVLILEDDLALPADLAAIIDALLKVAPRDWDFVRLSNQPRWAVRRVADFAGRYSLCRYSEVPGSTGASLVSKDGAVKFLKGGPRRFPVDQDLRRPWAWGLNMFGVAPAPITPDVLPQSSISTMSPSTGDRRRRQADAIRRIRSAETFARVALLLKEFGAFGGVFSVCVNGLARAVPKNERLKFLKRFAGVVGA